MLPNLFAAFLVMLMEAWSARRDAHLRFLKLQVEMLRSRLPGNRVILDPAERQPVGGPWVDRGGGGQDNTARSSASCWGGLVVRLGGFRTCPREA